MAKRSKVKNKSDVILLPNGEVPKHRESFGAMVPIDGLAETTHRVKSTIRGYPVVLYVKIDSGYSPADKPQRRYVRATVDLVDE